MLRSHTCGELRLTDVNKTVTLTGWVQRSRDLGGMTFIDLRDRYGITQVVIDNADAPEAHAIAESVRSEYVVRVSGAITRRLEGMENDKLETGAVELRATEIEILATAQSMRTEPVPAARLADAKSNMRYSLARTFDNTEAIASTLARFVHFSRSYDTLNNLFRLYAALTPEDLLEASRRYVTDERMVVTTLSSEALPAGMDAIPALASFASADEVSGPVAEVPFTVLRSANPQLSIRLLFGLGSAADPVGPEAILARTTLKVLNGDPE